MNFKHCFNRTPIVNSKHHICIYIYLSTYTICKCLEMSHNDHDHRKIHQTPFSPVATRVDWATLAARAELVRPYLVPVMFPELSEKHLATSVYQVWPWNLVKSGSKRKLDPKWVPERAKHSGRKIWHEMKGPWRLSPIEHNPKITNLFSRRAFLVTPRWWRSTWRFPITDHSWNVDIHARKSKRGRRANQVKSNNSRQISQVK